MKAETEWLFENIPQLPCIPDDFDIKYLCNDEKRDNPLLEHYFNVEIAMQHIAILCKRIN